MLKNQKTFVERLAYFLSKYWIWTFSLVYGFYILLPFAAPVFMKIGWERSGNALYWFYSFLCHQLPQRSFFLFGDKTMYSLPEIQAAYVETINPLVLRQFIGNPEMGWKVAWSDRMVSMYSSILLVSWVWYPWRKKLKNISFLLFGLWLLPMAIDGGTHLVSDFAGIGLGFRDSNLWLARLTDFQWGVSFYAGDGLGSFNSYMRLLTGLLFGVGVGWYFFPVVNETMQDVVRVMDEKYQKLEELREKVLRDIGI